MECTCVRYTDVPHTSRLFADLIYHPERVRPFYPYLPLNPGSYQAAAARLDFPEERRAGLVAALRRQNPESAALERLARPGTVAVVTGQQVGLFSGPAYTVYKALTAIRLSHELESSGIAAVPVFWLATEDHDFAEVNHFWTFDARHTPRKLELKRVPAPGQPVGSFVLREPPVAELREILLGFPFGAEVADLVGEAYGAGRTMGEAFSALLRRLLERYGLIHLDPMDPAVRALAAPAIRKALAQAPELSAEVLDRNRALQAAGYHAQVHVDEQTSFVFLLENGRRQALRRHQREYVLNGRRLSTEELMERAAELSPNALLRPVVQDFILPTVAYVGGPAELAYLAQSEVLYRHILGHMPVALHRTGFTLLNARAAKLLSRYGLALSDCFHGEEVLRERIAVKLIPPRVAGSLAETRSTVERAVDALRGELAAFDPTLASALDRSRKKIAYQLAKIERKAGREMIARDARAGGDAAYLGGLLYPDKHLQERLYSILPFLARHGLDLVDALYENIRLDCPDHQLLVI